MEAATIDSVHPTTAKPLITTKPSLFKDEYGRTRIFLIGLPLVLGATGYFIGKKKNKAAMFAGIGFAVGAIAGFVIDARIHDSALQKMGQYTTTPKTT